MESSLSSTGSLVPITSPSTLRMTGNALDAKSYAWDEEHQTWRYKSTGSFPDKNCMVADKVFHVHDRHYILGLTKVEGGS